MGRRRANRRTGPSKRAATVADVHAALDALAPFAAAAEWDNVGLLAGRMDWPAQRVLLALDLSDAVAEEAIRGGHDAVLAYHPPIFKGIRAITDRAEAPTRHLPTLLQAGISILAVHTALDAAVGGTNDVLLDAFDCDRRYPLEAAYADGAACKLVVFAPRDGVERLRRALADAGSGRIGHYAECSFELDGHGTFRGDETTNPTVGRRGVLERCAEVRLEMIVPAKQLGAAVRALYAHHTYEEPAFDVYPLRLPSGRGDVGMGRVGVLRRALRGNALLAALARTVDLSAATVVGSLRRTFTSVTAAAGSFGVQRFRDPDSLIVTGEMKHHDGLELVRRGVTSVVLGHYASERPALETLAERLGARVPDARFRVARTDRSPFQPVAASSRPAEQGNRQRAALRG